MKILVTGGAGYIGSHTCQNLTAAGHEVVVWDNLSTGFRALAKWGTFILGDILDTAKLTHCLRQHKIEGIIHFAAFSQVGESVENPGKYVHNNVLGTLSILESMKNAGVKNIVVSATAAVYGIPQRIPIVEDEPTCPINPYGKTKLFMEWMLHDFATAHGIAWMALRYFNAAGADPNGECGECHQPETHLIPRALMALTGELKDFCVWGDDYPTPDGSCIRDYIHVCDLAAAHRLAVEHLHKEKAGWGMSLNLGSGVGFSVKEIVSTVEKLTQQKLPHTVQARRAGDPPILVANYARAKEILNWQPAFSNAENIIQDAWNWHISKRSAVILGKP